MRDESDGTEQGLEGRTITKAVFYDDNDGDWGHHGDFYLWLDNGKIAVFSSSGYDADCPILEIVDEKTLSDSVRLLGVAV